VLVLREGMAAWMEAWDRLPRPDAAASSAHPTDEGPRSGEAGAELVRVLASMALGVLEVVS